jgi:hypothetical protein
MATYGDLDPNAMPDMYHKEYVEPVSGQGLISSLFAGPATPTNKVVPNDLRSGKTLVPTGISISAGEPVDLNTDDILSQITAQSDIGDKGVIGADVFEDPNAMNPFENRFDPRAEDLQADIQREDLTLRYPLSNKIKENQEEPTTPSWRPNPPPPVNNSWPYHENLGGSLSGVDKTNPNSIGNLLQQFGSGVKEHIITPARDKILENIQRLVNNQSMPTQDNSSTSSYPSNFSDANEPNSPNMGYGPSFDQVAPVGIDEVVNPDSPNMSTGPSMNLNEMTVSNPNAISILPGQEPGGGRAGTDSIIQSLGLLEMSEAQRAERIAALPEHIRDAVIERVTNIMQSASIGDDIY